MMVRTMLKSGLSVMFAAAVGVVQAEDWYLKGTVGSDTVQPLTDPSYWTNLTGTVCSAIDAKDVFHVESGYKLTVGGSTTFVPTIHMGKSDGSQNGIFNWRKPSVTFTDLRWNRGEFILNYSNAEPKILGDIFVANGTVAHQIHFSQTTSPGSVAAFTFGCQFHGDAKQEIYILHHTSATADVNKSFQFQIAGDNRDWNGSFKVDKYANAVFSHANALGNPDSPRADALRLGDHARFAVKKGVTLNSARGISLVGDDVRIMATNFTTYGATDCTSYTLAMPISGTKGFAKTGQGSVTLAGAYSAGPITVENGTLVLNEAGSFPAGLAVTVEAGAKLIQRTVIPNLQVTCQPGGTWERHLVVPYDSTAQTATPLDLTTAPADFFPLEIQLSNKIGIPCPTIQPFAVAYLPEGPSVADFTDASVKTYELPHTSFRIETDDQNRRVLILEPKPVVQSAKDFPHTLGGPNNAGDGYWVNYTGVPRAGYDFLMTHVMSELGKAPFNGDSITYAKSSGSTAINVRVGGGTGSKVSVNASYIDASVYYTRYFIPNYSGIPQKVIGKVHVIGALGDANPIELRAKYSATSDHPGGTIDYAFDVDGAAPLKLTCDTGDRARDAQLTFSGDNSAYVGKITVTDNYTAYPEDAEHKGLRLIFNEAKNLGGALESFTYDALKIDRYARLCPTQDVVLATANRGIYVTTGGVSVASGVTLTLKQPLRVNGLLFKHGAGTLALGGTVSFGAKGTSVGTRNELFVREGFVEALADDAVAGFKTVFADGAGIRVAPGAGVTAGFTGTLEAEGRIAVSVDMSQPGFKAESGCEAPICTVANDSGITVKTFAVERIKGYSGTVVAESAGEGLTRYVYTCRPEGFLILVQ